MIKTKKSKLTKALMIVIIVVAAVVFTFPIFYMVISSFKVQVDMFNVEKLFVFEPTLNNYISCIFDYDILGSLKSSIIVSVGATLLACLIGLPAAYYIARHNMYKLSGVVLCARIIPAITFLVPWYIIFGKIGILDTYIGLILANLLVLIPLIVWIVAPYFGTIPKELEEAAFIDGCSDLKSFLMIMIPLSKPGIFTAAILAFIQVWNNYMYSYILAGNKIKTLPVMIKIFIGYTNINYTCLITAAVIVAMPVVIISIFLQKYIVGGLAAGAVKG